MGGLLSQSNYLIMEASAPSACAVMIFSCVLTSCQVSSVTTCSAGLCFNSVRAATTGSVFSLSSRVSQAVTDHVVIDCWKGGRDAQD